MAEAVVVYRGDWAAVRGVLVPRSIVQSGRTDEWIAARSRGEVLECPEVQRTWRIADHMQTTSPKCRCSASFNAPSGASPAFSCSTTSAKRSSGGLDNACRLRVTCNNDELTFELNGSQVL